MVATLDGRMAGSSIITNALDNYLYRSGGVSYEDEVNFIRVGIKESKCTLPDSIDAVTGQC